MKGPVEFWRKHPDIDGIEVSSFGRVRSAKEYCYANYLNKKGYLQVGFHMNGKQVTKRVHRLVAEAFIPNPNNLPQVNHKDGNRSNNNASNLEWCDNAYNSQYREKFGTSSAEVLRHPVLVVNLTTLEVSRFPSQGEASRVLGFSQTNISAAISGRLKQTHGYWIINADERVADIVKRKIHDIKKSGFKANIVSADFVRQVLAE